MSMPSLSLPSPGFLQRLCLIFALGTLGGAVLVRLLLPTRLEALREVEPGPRLRRLLFWGALPLGAGGFVTSIGLAPSLLHRLGVGHDHCHGPSGHALELCLLHAGHLQTSSSLGWIVVGLGAGWLLFYWGNDLREFWYSQRARRRLDEASRDVAPPTHRRLSTSRLVAATLGLLSPRVFLSDGLCEHLDAPRLEAVLAHERHHAAQRHGLTCFVVRLLSRAHLPSLQRRLHEEVEWACEQSADLSAADHLESPVPVAEALVEVERTETRSRKGVASMSFETHRLERRVRDLLEDEWRSPSIWPPVALVVGMSGLLLAHASVHRALEMGLGVFW